MPNCLQHQDKSLKSNYNCLSCRCAFAFHRVSVTHIGVIKHIKKQYLSRNTNEHSLNIIKAFDLKVIVMNYGNNKKQVIQVSVESPCFKD
jgi:hypothetical protein